MFHTNSPNLTPPLTPLAAPLCARAQTGVGGVLRGYLSDPRALQIAALTGFVLIGVRMFHFDVALVNSFAIFATALFVQKLGAWITDGRFDPLSPLITALSLTLLLRTSDPALAALAAALAIGSKFVLRAGGGHVFNPANFGLCAVAVCFQGAWISPGQWGSGALAMIAFAALGLAVSGRAGRIDAAVAFLAAWALVVFGRALWLGDPMAIPIRQMQSGALLLFAFFMITDPKTTPRDIWARMAFCALAALVAGVLVFVYYQPLGVIYALFICAPLTPVFNWARPGPVYAWRSAPNPESSIHA